MKITLFVSSSLFFLLSPLLGAETFREKETKVAKEKRLAWWSDAKFGMFVHWGLYSASEGQWKDTAYPDMRPGIEWLMCKGGAGAGAGGIPVENYLSELGPKMTLSKFNPEEWAALAQEAGMRYFVITAKHHDGFGMVDFPDTDYDIAAQTPYGKDPMLSLSKAIRAQGLRFGFYFSQSQDWSKEGGRPTWFKGKEGDWTAYARQHAVPQLRHLLSGRYGQIDQIWFDSGSATKSREGAELIWQELAATPPLIVNNRLKQGFNGDYGTPEQWIPPRVQAEAPWETCMTLNGSWGYNPTDNHWKSEEELIRNLCKVVGRGGNFLLNVGPRADGSIESEAIVRLKAIGKWLNKNGAAIYGTRANPLGVQRWGEITYKIKSRKGATLYGLVTQWPQNGQILLPLEQEPISMQWHLRPDSPLEWQRTEDGLRIQLGEHKPPASAVTVFQIELREEPKAIPLVIYPDEVGSYEYRAGEADTSGGIKMHPQRPHLSYWTGSRKKKKTARWRCRIQEAGQYQLGIEYGHHTPENTTTPSAAFVLRIGDATSKISLSQTGSKPHPHNKEKQTLKLIEKWSEKSFRLQPGLYELEVSAVGVPEIAQKLTRTQLKNGYGQFAELNTVKMRRHTKTP